jgi:hypothetical protein
LCFRPDYDDAVVAARRVERDVGKVQIERHQDSALALAGGKHSGVGAPRELFISHCVGVKARLFENLRALRGQVLVDLEFQT